MSDAEPSIYAPPDESHDWGYEGRQGPWHWSELDPANEACGHAGTQSPVNLSSRTPVRDLPDLIHDYEASPIHLINTGHTVQYDYAAGSKVRLGSRSYELVQMHFHAHSEHALDGAFAPIELHLVHRDQGGNFLVVGVFGQRGAENATLTAAGWDALPREAGERLEDDRGLLDAAALIPGGPTYRYEGSLTTPPCTEAVSWVIYERPITLSAAQLDAFAQVYDHDFRPLQPLGARAMTRGE